MICISCSTQIPPEWKACIQTNKCPACGGDIMNDSMQELLTELKSAMERMPSDPEGLAGWLLSHYQLHKIGSGEPVQEFYGEKKKQTKLKSREKHPLAVDEEDNDGDWRTVARAHPMAISALENTKKVSDFIKTAKETYKEVPVDDFEDEAESIVSDPRSVFERMKSSKDTFISSNRPNDNDANLIREKKKKRLQEQFEYDDEVEE